MPDKEKRIINDEIDLASLASVVFDNFNLLLSIFLTSIFVVSIYYLSATKLYQSNSLLEIKQNNTSFLPQSLRSGLNSDISEENSMRAEIEIYKSRNTILDALNNLRAMSNEKDIPSLNYVKSNLLLKSISPSLMEISFVSNNKQLSSEIINQLNREFIKDRQDFIKQSSTAGRVFIQKEIPRIKTLLKEAEENLNNFKISTNKSDVIFDSNTRNQKLERLRNRVDEIVFKELELKEFYKENHPIYLTLSEQKKLVLSQIEVIESDLPNIPTTQRTLENFKREVEIYSDVLKDLSSQELSLGMSEASSLSNVRIINEASAGAQISPRLTIFAFTLVSTLFFYLILLIRHFLGDRITNLDALSDFVGKENILGELPFIDSNSDKNKFSINIAEELINKTIYEITNSPKKFNSISIIGSRKDVGKSEVSKRIFNKLKERHKVCLLDLDYRKKGLTKEILGDVNFKNFEEFNLVKNEFYDDAGSLFVPSFEIEDPPNFFNSSQFVDEIEKLKENFDFVLCDTPPWNLFVDAKIISNHFNQKIFIVCEQISTFKDIDSISQELNNKGSLNFFYNKFNLYFNFLWFKYQYPYYSRNYYYDYNSYSGIRKHFTFKGFLVELPTNIRKIASKWLNFLKEIFRL